MALQASYDDCNDEEMVVCLCDSVTISATSQSLVKVPSPLGILLYASPHYRTLQKQNVMAANGIVGTPVQINFKIWLCNLGNHPTFNPRRIRVAARGPLSLPHATRNWGLIQGGLLQHELQHAVSKPLPWPQNRPFLTTLFVPMTTPNGQLPPRTRIYQLLDRIRPNRLRLAPAGQYLPKFQSPKGMPWEDPGSF